MHALANSRVLGSEAGGHGPCARRVGGPLHQNMDFNQGRLDIVLNLLLFSYERARPPLSGLDISRSSSRAWS